MKSFKQLISEVAQPKSQDEINFKDKHMYDKIDYPVDGTEGQFTSDKKKATRNADYEDDEDQEVYESRFKGGLGIDMIPMISDEAKEVFEIAGFERASSKTGPNTFDFPSKSGDVEALEQYLISLGYQKSRNNIMVPKNNKIEGEHGISEVGFFGGKVKLVVSASMKENMQESFSVFKSMPAAPGKSVSNKVQIKAFKTSDQMNKFLSTNDNALQWKDTGKQGLKSGAYKMDMRRGPDGKPARDFIREVSDTKESAFVAKAAAAKKAGKDEFELGNKKFPVTIKKATADKIMEKKTYGPGHIGAIQKMIDKEREAKKAKDAMKKEYTSESIDSLYESNAHVAISSLISAINKNRNKPEFEKAADQFEKWGQRYRGSYRNLLNVPGMAGSFFSDLVDILDIRVDLDEEPQPKWKVQIGNRHYTVTGRSTMEADRKAKILAKKDGNIGVGGKIERLKEEVELDEAVAKIACLNCDEVSTAAAWKKNRGFCPKCKVSNQGVAEEVGIDEVKTELGEAKDSYRKASYIDMVVSQVPQKHKKKLESEMRKYDVKELKSRGADWWMETGRRLHNESVELDEASKAPKMKPDFFKQQRDSDIARNLAQGKTPTGREKRTRTQSSTQKSLASIRKESIDLAENFKAGSVKLDDGSTVIVKKQDADLLNKMFNDLNTQNKKQMMKVAMTDKNGFEEILGFAREAL